MFRHAVLVGSVLVGVAAGWSMSGMSAAYGQKGKTAAKGTKMSLKAGKVEQVLPAQGILVTAEGKKYAVGFNQTSKVGLVGNASIDIVEAGAYVQATVDMDGELKPSKPVTKLQVTEMSAINEPGLFPEAGPDAKPGEPGKYFVRGTVKVNKGDSMSVMAGNKLVTFELAPGVVVPVTLSAWQLAKPGDSISGDCDAYPAMNTPGGPLIPVVGTKITISAAQLITGK